MSTSIGATWPSIEAFYDADPRRRTSGEADFGVWWTDGVRPHHYYRISYIEATGEVYAYNQSSGTVEVLGYCKPDEGRCYYQTLDAILKGWPDMVQEPGLPWIRQRLAATAVPS